jgi:hypothetical protein
MAYAMRCVRGMSFGILQRAAAPVRATTAVSMNSSLRSSFLSTSTVRSFSSAMSGKQKLGHALGGCRTRRAIQQPALFAGMYVPSLCIVCFDKGPLMESTIATECEKLATELKSLAA